MPEVAPEVLLQLAQYQPCRDGGGTREATFRQMVGPVLMEAGGQVDSPSAVREAFKVFFGVEIEASELNDWLRYLEQKGAVRRDGATVALTHDAEKLFAQRKHDFELLSTRAKQEWRTTLVGIDPSLTDQDLADLESDLDTLIARIVAYHGAEAAVILYPKEERSDALRHTLLAKREELPSRAANIREIRRTGLAQFFSAPTDAQRLYLADRLDHGFFATVGTLRPEAAGVMKEELAGQRLYLDTNVLIPALGLAGGAINRSTRRMLDLTRGLGVKLVVTPLTLEEFQHSLKRSKDEISTRGLPDRRYAEVLRNVAREIGGVSLAEGFYESYGDRGSSPEEWFRKAAQVDPRLEELEITVETEAVAAVTKNDAARIADYVVLLNREAVFGRTRPRPRDDPPMVHDAFHRVLIERLRGSGFRHFGSAQYWFLTEDKVLPRFGQLALDGEQTPSVPFCISAAAWTQIARCFTPRTEDYDQTITDLLASPYLRFGRGHNLGEVQTVVSRITTLLDDASPAVVAAFIGDETLEAVTSSHDEQQQDVILITAYERTQDELEERFKTLNTRLEAMETKLNAEQDERAESIAAADAIRIEQRVTEEALNDERRRAEELKADLHRERASSEREIERLKREMKDAETERLNKRNRRVQAIPLFSACLLAMAAVILRLTGTISLAATLVGGGCAVALLIGRQLEKSRWAWTVAFGLAVVGVALALLPLLK